MFLQKIWGFTVVSEAILGHTITRSTLTMPLVQMCLWSQVSYYLWQTHVRTLSSGKHTRPRYPEDMLCSLISRPSCIFSARFTIDIGTFSTDNSGMPLVARASAPLCPSLAMPLYLCGVVFDFTWQHIACIYTEPIYRYVWWWDKMEGV